MTVAQFSRDDMLLYQGREEGIRLTQSVIRLDEEGYAISDIATELRISEEEVKKILEK
ncbi:MAG: helix-turn-helix domain-containing protein [Clostridiales bacterium]|nr:helix-turn-helix domain-containing protein [Clostridiales bacterium]